MRPFEATKLTSLPPISPAEALSLPTSDDVRVKLLNNRAQARMKLCESTSSELIRSPLVQLDRRPAARSSHSLSYVSAQFSESLTDSQDALKLEPNSFKTVSDTCGADEIVRPSSC